MFYTSKQEQVKITDTTFIPQTPPHQKSRTPIWILGSWHSKKSMGHALRYDDLLPNILNEKGKVRMSPPNR